MIESATNLTFPFSSHFSVGTNFFVAKYERANMILDTFIQCSAQFDNDM